MRAKEQHKKFGIAVPDQTLETEIVGLSTLMAQLDLNALSQRERYRLSSDRGSANLKLPVLILSPHYHA